MAGKPTDDREGVEVIDGDRVLAEERLTSATSRPTTALTLALAVVVVAGLIWLVVAGSGSAERADGAGDEQTTTTVAATTAPATAPATSPAASAGGPVLAEVTGLWLFYGGADPLQRVDLDSGQLDTYGLRASPVAATGGELIVAAADASIGWLSLADPGEQAQGWQDAHPARGDEPGHLWLLSADPPQWSRIDVSTNQLVERRELPPQATGDRRIRGRREALLPGPDLLDTASGIYDHGDGGYTRVGEGRLLEFDGARALVETCGTTLDECDLQWVDRADWQPIELPLPEQPIRSAELLAGGRWLHVDGADGTSALLALEPDHPVGHHELVPGHPFTVSPDGRWLATGDAGGEVTIVDLTSAEVVATVDLLARRLGGALLLVEQPS